MRLSVAKSNAISTICADAAQITFASMVIPAFISGIHKTSGPLLIMGIASTIFLWIASIILAKQL